MTALSQRTENLTAGRWAISFFSHSDKLALLNNTIYPYITYEVISMCGNTDKHFVLLDAPTLFESGIDFICDGIISVTCDKEKVDTAYYAA